MFKLILCDLQTKKVSALQIFFQTMISGKRKQKKADLPN